jgi:hypothetical protein
MAPSAFSSSRRIMGSSVFVSNGCLCFDFVFVYYFSLILVDWGVVLLLSNDDDGRAGTIFFLFLGWMKRMDVGMCFLFFLRTRNQRF